MTASDRPPQVLFPAKSFQSELNQAVYQLGVRYASGFPQLWVHTDFRKSRNGVDLVDGRIFENKKKKIHAGHSLTDKDL
jgi:hypothetical protein